MVDIVKDERRLPKVGEICGVRLKDIYGYQISVYDDWNSLDDNYRKNAVKYVKKLTSPDGTYIGDNRFNYHFTSNFSCINDDGIVLLKYVGRGLFVETISGEVIDMAIWDLDDLRDDDNYYFTDEADRRDISVIQENGYRFRIPENYREFELNYDRILSMPLFVDCDNCPLYKYDESLRKEVNKQDPDMVRGVIEEAKRKVLEEVKKQKEMISMQDQYIAEVEEVMPRHI